MRLSKQQQKIIHDEVGRFFGEQARVKLFGSRLDDTKKGGDIDLLIELPEKPDEMVKKELNLNARLIQLLGDQKIDLLLVFPGIELAPVHRHAQQTGVTL